MKRIVLLMTLWMPFGVFAQTASVPPTGNLKTTEATKLIRDVTTGATLLTVPKKQKLPILGCIQLNVQETSRWFWTTFQGKYGYVSLKTATPERGAKFDCPERVRLNDHIVELELAGMDAEANKRTGQNRPFVDRYLAFVSDLYTQRNGLILQDMNVYPGEKPNALNVFFKAMNCHATKPIKSMKFFFIPMNNKNKAITTVPKELAVLGPFDPGCAFAEFNFMGAITGRNIKDVQISKLVVEYEGQPPVTFTKTNLNQVFGCRLQKGGCLQQYDAQKP